MSETQVVKQESSKALAAPTAAWGAETVDAADIIIPKILLMQGLSQAVADGDAAMGDLVDSLTGDKLGSGREKDKKDLELVPLMSYKEWVVYEKLSGGKVQFKGIVPHGPENASWERETEDERRDLTLNFFVMLRKDIDDAGALPYLLSFRRTSYKAGKKLATHFVKSQAAGKPPAATTFALSAKKVDGDQGTYYVFDVNPVSETPVSALQTEGNLYTWYTRLRTGAAKVDHRDVEETATEKGAVDEEQARF